MSQQLSLSSVFSVLALAALCLANNGASDGHAGGFATEKMSSAQAKATFGPRG